MSKRGWIIVAVLICLGSLWFYLSGMNDGDSGLDGPGPDGIGGDSPGNPSGGSAIVANVAEIWANAVQQFEGWFPGSRSYRDNNPGNIEGVGDDGSDGVYAKFSSFAAGEAALIADLTAKLARYPGYTIVQVVNRYLNGSAQPGAPGYQDPTSYANFVADAFSQALGLDVDPNTTTLSDLQSMGDNS